MYKNLILTSQKTQQMPIMQIKVLTVFKTYNSLFLLKSQRKQKKNLLCGQN